VHKTEQAKHSDENAHESYRVRLPRAIGDGDVGLGDVPKRATSALGVNPVAAANGAVPRLTVGSFSVARVRISKNTGG
jgi:hypothetical protein